MLQVLDELEGLNLVKDGKGEKESASLAFRGSAGPPKLPDPRQENTRRTLQKDAWLQIEGGKAPQIDPLALAGNAQGLSEAKIVEQAELIRELEEEQQVADDEAEIVSYQNKASNYTQAVLSRGSKVESLETELGELELQVADSKNMANKKGSKRGKLGVKTDLSSHPELLLYSRHGINRLGRQSSFLSRTGEESPIVGYSSPRLGRAGHRSPTASIRQVERTSTSSRTGSLDAAGSRSPLPSGFGDDFSKTASERRGRSRGSEVVGRYASDRAGERFTRDQIAAAAAAAPRDGVHQTAQGKYLGDEDLTVEGRALSLTMENNQHAAKTFHDLNSWCSIWFSDLRSMQEEETGTSIEMMVNTAFNDVASWDESVLQIEAQGAIAQFKGLDTRVEHLLLLYSGILQKTLGAPRLDLPEVPPFGLVLQAILSCMLSTPLVSLQLILGEEETNEDRMIVINSAVRKALHQCVTIGTPESQGALASSPKSLPVPKTSRTVKSAVSASGQVSVNRLTAQPSEKASAIRAKIEEGSIGPRLHADSYFIKGTRVFVFAPKNVQRVFGGAPLALPVSETEADVLYGISKPSREEGGLARKSKSGLTHPLRLDGGREHGPTLLPSFISHAKGFMQQAAPSLEQTPPPAQQLELAFVFGINATECKDCIRMTADGKIVYFAATVCVVQTRTESRHRDLPHQQFFRGHDDTVLSLDIYPEKQPPTGSVETIAASGQIFSHRSLLSSASGGAGRPSDARALGPEAEREAVAVRRGKAYVCVWSTASMKELARLGYYRESFLGSIISISFCSEGSRVACLTNDSRHTLCIWSWEQEAQLVEIATHQNDVYQVLYNKMHFRDDQQMLATYGKRHIRFWTLGRLGTTSTDSSSRVPLQSTTRPQKLYDQPAAWDLVNRALSGEGLFRKGVSMEEAGSDQYLDTQYLKKRPGHLAGDGKSASIPATQTINRWAGKNYAASFPEDPEEKLHAVTDTRVVGDPGKKNLTWEEDTVLQVVMDGTRPPYEPKGMTSKEMARQHRQEVMSRRAPELVGRYAKFEMTTTPEDPHALPRDPYELLRRVENDKVPERDALRKLAGAGWSENVVQRYRSIISETKEKPKGDNEKKSAKQRESEAHLLAFGSSLKGTRSHGKEMPVPDTILCAGFCMKQAADNFRQSSGYALLCGDDKGFVYRFETDLDPPTDTGEILSPKSFLRKRSACHEGPVNCIHVFLNGSFITGGVDKMVRLWTPAMEAMYTLERDGFVSEWALRAPITHLKVWGHEASHHRGLEVEDAILTVVTNDNEIHSIPLEPSKLMKLESTWTPTSLYSIVWAWKDPLKVNYVGINPNTSRVLSAPFGLITGVCCNPQKDELAISLRQKGTGAVHIMPLVTDDSPRVRRLREEANCIDFSPDGSLVAVGTSVGTIHFISSTMATVIHSTPLSTFPIHCVKFSPDGHLLAASCKGKKMYILRCDLGFCDDPVRMQTVGAGGESDGHTANVTGIDWSSSSDFIRSSGGIRELVYWSVDRIGLLSQADKGSSLRNVVWASTNAVVGWEVQGIWKKDLQPVEINSVASNSIEQDFPGENGTTLQLKQNIVTTDARGLLHLMRFPALGRVEMKSYPGHAGAVGTARFTATDQYVVSVGTADSTVLVWKVSSPSVNEEWSSEDSSDREDLDLTYEMG